MNTEEFILNAVKVHGDKFNYSNVNFINWTSKIKITCCQNHVFEQSPRNHLYRKHGCPECAPNRKLTNEFFLNKAKKIHPTLSFETEVTKSSQIVVINCSIYGKYSRNVRSILSGQGCPKCYDSDLSIKMQQEFLYKVKSLTHKYDFSKTRYIGSEFPIIVTCKLHGDFEILPHCLLRSDRCKTGCRKCSNLSYSTKTYIQEAIRKWGDRFDYSLTELKFSIEEYRRRKSEKITIICKKGHIFERCPHFHIIKGSGCPFCAGRVKTTQDFLREAREKHGDYYDYSKSVYINKNTKLIVICPIHKEFLVSPGCHIGQGVGCKNCNISHGERGVETFLQKNNIHYISQYRFLDCKFKKPLVFDFFLPNLNICIEFDGYWHFNAHPNDLIRFDNVIRRDRIKNIYCRENHIPLVRINNIKLIESTLTNLLKL